METKRSHQILSKAYLATGSKNEFLFKAKWKIQKSKQPNIPVEDGIWLVIKFWKR